MGLFNKKTQELLKEKTVAIIGVGALGTVAAYHIARAGIGTVRLIDRDFVELSNLQRQMLFDEDDVKQNLPKVIAAQQKLNLITGVNIQPCINDVNATSIEELVGDCDLIIDATDNMATRFLINDVSIKHNIPWVYGGAIHSRGMFFSIIPDETPCLQCLFPGSYEQHGETCDTVGVLGPLVNIIASYQVIEACKILLGYKKYVNKQLNQIDTWNFDYDEIPIEYSQNPECPCCANRNFTYLENQENEMFISQLCGRDSIQITPSRKTKLDLQKWAKKWEAIGNVTITPFLLRLDYSPYQLTLFQDGRLLIKGAQTETEAKNIYARFIGH
ncbi:ThiF family adenylyltransferase [Bacillus sp. FJAT-45350]|uniref:ThiF family adenylyltransferase n=1 Tax=Bacillus sp. FJAT-45350 TaxID=2011014 RepID=UPI000BB67D8E|nr:ThiF family adenylyltransferase [Bacillus sp. FJAT-45350]